MHGMHGLEVNVTEPTEPCGLKWLLEALADRQDELVERVTDGLGERVTEANVELVTVTRLHATEVALAVRGTSGEVGNTALGEFELKLSKSCLACDFHGYFFLAAAKRLKSSSPVIAM